MFSHGWPLPADDWDTRMLLFLQQGYGVIAHDRRTKGHYDGIVAWSQTDFTEDLKKITVTNNRDILAFMKQPPSRLARGAVLV